jgi:hypothetical protein
MNAIKFFAVLCAALLALVNADAAFAKGGGSNFMNSAGYQRALKESRERYTRPYTTPLSVYPGRKWRHRAWRHRRH